MPTIRKLEETGIFGGTYEITLSCGHQMKTERKPAIRVGDSLDCPTCGKGWF